MNSRKTLALAELPPKRDVATDRGSQGPMSQQNTGGSGSNELHPQKLVQLVGYRDPNAQKHKADASVAAGLASAACATRSIEPDLQNRSETSRPPLTDFLARLAAHSTAHSTAHLAIQVASKFSQRDYRGRPLRTPDPPSKFA
jgi:hypothetical protein